MKLRRKHKAESEIFTDTLVDILFIMLMFFLIISTAANPNIKKVATPRGSKNTKAKQNLVVTIDKQQRFFVGAKEINPFALDSIIAFEVDKIRKTSVDSPTVVINADTLANYGGVFRIIESAAKAKAKVVTKVE